MSPYLISTLLLLHTLITLFLRQVSCAFLSYCYLVDYDFKENEDNDKDGNKVSKNDLNVKPTDVEVIQKILTVCIRAAIWIALGIHAAVLINLAALVAVIALQVTVVDVVAIVAVFALVVFVALVVTGVTVVTVVTIIATYGHV